jgi:general secretion pathway protein F
VFQYKALNEEGEYVEGEINLSSEETAIAELIRLNFTPIKLIKVKDKKNKGLLLSRNKKFEAQQFFENIYDYLDSGLSIDKALELEAKSINQNNGMTFITELVDMVRQGESLSKAMQNFPEQFSALYVGVVHVGEETDSLSESLQLLARLTHDLQEFKQKIKSALIYPMILSGVMLISVLVLFGLVIPRFKSLFVGMGIEMTGITGVVVGISDVLTQNYQVLLLILALFIVIFSKIFKSALTDQGWAKYFLKAPVIGGMIQQYNLYIISMILHILMKKRITIIKALDHVKDAVGNIVYKNEIEIMTREISRGKSIQDVLNTEFFTSHFIYIVAVGEETGRLTESFAKLSRYYYKQLDVRIKSLMTYAEPAIILVLGLVVGLIVVSMLQAILSINELAV